MLEMDRSRREDGTTMVLVGNKLIETVVEIGTSRITLTTHREIKTWMPALVTTM